MDKIKCFSAKRSSCLNVETKPNFSVYPMSHLCVVLYNTIHEISGCHVDTRLINMHEAHRKVSAEGH